MDGGIMFSKFRDIYALANRLGLEMLPPSASDEEQMQNINTSLTICTDLTTPQTFDCTEKAISTSEDGAIMGMYTPPPVEGEEEDDSMMAATIVFSVPENS
jgi:hypothetical protein